MTVPLLRPSTAVGIDHVAKSAPDGYTLLVGGREADTHRDESPDSHTA